MAIQVHAASPTCQLLIEKSIVVGPPANLCQIFAVLPKTMMSGPRGLDLLGKVAWQTDVQPTRQRRFPPDEFPFTAPLAISIRADEAGIHFQFGSHAMLPLV